MPPSTGTSTNCSPRCELAALLPYLSAPAGGRALLLAEAVITSYENGSRVSTVE
jgi:hypothetical protein